MIDNIIFNKKRDADSMIFLSVFQWDIVMKWICFEHKFPLQPEFSIG